MEKNKIKRANEYRKLLNSGIDEAHTAILVTLKKAGIDISQISNKPGATNKEVWDELQQEKQSALERSRDMANLDVKKMRELISQNPDDRSSEMLHLKVREAEKTIHIQNTAKFLLMQMDDGIEGAGDKFSKLLKQNEEVFQNIFSDEGKRSKTSVTKLLARLEEFQSQAHANIQKNPDTGIIQSTGSTKAIDDLTKGVHQN